ncbi:hypothetical protein ACIRLA_33750 [Streptomyces sp. NPDC102364]|uniref:hypothetical protein n=1 Tax=Streptomyces sp. NPDC102364 TaxID=3366161 RepID=UPI00381E874C
MAHRARFAALDEAIKHREHVDIYLIHTMPSTKATARYNRLDATIITVDPGRDIVLQRVHDMRSPGLLAVATRWYRRRKRLPAPTGRQSSREW